MSSLHGELQSTVSILSDSVAKGGSSKGGHGPPADRRVKKREKRKKKTWESIYATTQTTPNNDICVQENAVFIHKINVQKCPYRGRGNPHPLIEVK